MDTLLGLASQPLVFLIRDPRLTVSSRINVREKMGVDGPFPVVESGWEALRQQVEICRARGIDYLIVDSHCFRSQPERVFKQVAERLEVEFTSVALEWDPVPDVSLSNHRTSGVDHFFTRVLNSSRLQPPNEGVPDLASFPSTGGMRSHVEWAMDVYRDLLSDNTRIQP